MGVSGSKRTQDRNSFGRHPPRAQHNKDYLYNFLLFYTFYCGYSKNFVSLYAKDGKAPPTETIQQTMGRKPNDGRGRLGGRAKGTPNKPISPVLDWLNNFLDKQRPSIEAQFSRGAWGKEDAKIYALLSVAAALRENTEALRELNEERGEG